MQKEIWKDVPNYNGDYKVSNLGNVKSFKAKEEIILKPRILKRGYFYVNLSKKGEPKSCYVHHLVAITFLNHKPDGHKIVIDHIDNDKLNNHKDNLQLISHRENCSKWHKANSKGSSKFIGVCWAKEVGKWKAAINIKRKEILLGYFESEYDAHLTYQKRLEGIK